MDYEPISTASEELARHLMRQGVDDETIAARTTIPMMRLLGLRAEAASENAATPKGRRRRGESSGS